MRWGATVVGLAGSCHPGPVAAVTVLITALAITAGQSGPRCALTAAAVLAGQVSVGWCNDAVDARRDTAADRRGKPVVDGTVSVSTVRTAAFLALALCVPLSFGCGPWAGTVHLTGVMGAWGYDLWLKATVWSWLPYALGFASLPAFVALGLPGQPGPAWWVVSAGALLGVGAHLGDVLPDIRGDLATGSAVGRSGWVPTARGCSCRRPRRPPRPCWCSDPPVRRAAGACWLSYLRWGSRWQARCWAAAGSGRRSRPRSRWPRWM